MTPEEKAQETANAIAGFSGIESFPRAVIMGSGWAEATNKLGAPLAEVSYEKLPHVAPPAVPGHQGKLRVYLLSGKPTLVFLGRTHLYEGHGVHASVHFVRSAAALGTKSIILTNGCGSTNPDLEPGTTVLISDHINLTGTNPLEGPQFTDMTNAYSKRLRIIVHKLLPETPEGIYAQFRGPSYETPAEVKMARLLGAGLVGMSTVLENIVANASGMEVLGISLVTNLAAGITGQPLNHEEVVETGKEAANNLSDKLLTILSHSGI